MKQLLLFALAALAFAQPTIDVPGFEVRTVVTGLNMPTTMAFLGPDDFLVLEKNTGRVLRFRNGAAAQQPVLDLSVNNASERGLLGIALHPNFPTDRGVYLFWTCRTSAPGTVANGPTQETCDQSMMTGIDDSSDVLAVPLRGNRVDRFSWDGEKLTFDRNIIALRSFQADGHPTPPGQGDETQPARGNHDGGVIAFGPDGKLYIFFGDQGRRGHLQNLENGPTGPNVADDQFGGPDADDNHLSGVILRLNPDGSAPDDNPFVRAASRMTGQAAANWRKVFAYGLRNSFGITFDPFSGSLWMSEHGDDTFDELNLVRPGMNGGWVQVIGPISRISEFRDIENSFFAPPEPFPSLQQWRWPPSRIAPNQGQARSRMFMVPGANYSDPQFSWRWAALPGALGFAPPGFGADIAGDLLVALVGNPRTAVGYLMRFPMHTNRRAFEFDQAALNDRVADNSAKYDLTESQPLIIGSGFGIATDMKLSSRNTVYVVSLSNSAIYEVARTAPMDADDQDQDFRGTGQPLRATFLSPRGDSLGSLEVRLNSGRERFCYEISLANAPANATLFLRQQVGDTDISVLELTPATQGSACVHANRQLLRTIRANAGQFYISLDGQPIQNSAGFARLQ